MLRTKIIRCDSREPKEDILKPGTRWGPPGTLTTIRGRGGALNLARESTLRGPSSPTSQTQNGLRGRFGETVAERGPGTAGRGVRGGSSPARPRPD